MPTESEKSKFVLGYFDDGEHRAGTGRYLAEIIGVLDRTRFIPVFFAPNYRAWHEDLIALGVETVYLTELSTDVTESTDKNAGSIHRLTQINPDYSRNKNAQSRIPFRIPPTLAWWLGLRRETKRLDSLFRKRRVDLLHSNNTGAESAPIAAKRAGISRVLGTFHVLPSYDLTGERSGFRFRWLERKSMAALDRAIGCCEAATRDWQTRTGFRDGLAITIHNGIDVNRVQRTQPRDAAKANLGFSPSEILIGAVGNLHPYKGHTHLLSAFRGVFRENPQTRLLIVGTGPEEASLRAQLQIYAAQTPEIADAVHFLGFCSDVRSVLEALDIFVQASLVEAFPMAILEASGIGLPVVATAVGGVPEAIIEGETGRLVPKADPKSLATALLEVSRSAALRERMGEAGRANVCANFTREQMVARTLEIYEEMLKS